MDGPSLLDIPVPQAAVEPHRWGVRLVVCVSDCVSVSMCVPVHVTLILFVCMYVCLR